MDKRTTQYVKTLSSMIDCETVSDFYDPTPIKYENFQKVLKELFPNVFKNFKLELFNGSMLLHLDVESKKNPILLMSHQDVVEPNGTWITKPFKAEVIDGKLYGRGTLDTKGNLFAIFQSLEELLVEGYKFNRSIYIESSCNEETTQFGAIAIFNELRKRNIHFDWTLDEGGMIVDNPFNPGSKAAMVALGEKFVLEIKFTSRGNGGHSSTPSTTGPLISLANFMIEANKQSFFKAYFPSTLVDLLKIVGKDTKGLKGFLFRHANAFKWILKALFTNLSPLTRAMVKTTIAFTRIKGAEANNVIPEEAYVVANIRVSHKDGLKFVNEKMEKLAKKYNLEVEYLDKGFESKICSTKTKEFAYLTSMIDKHFPGTKTLPYIATGASDSKFIQDLTDNVFRFAPFTVSNEQLNTIHEINENVDIEALPKAVDFFKDIIKGWN